MAPAAPVRTAGPREFWPVVEPLVPALRRYARSLVNERAAADDLVQDSLERAIRGWPHRRVDGEPRTWLFTILHNVAVNRLRQMARRGPHVGLDDASDSVLARPPAQEDGLRYNELMRALDTLPMEQRSVLLLVSVEELSYEQAARVLDIPIGTVMSRLSRARRKLLQTMDDADQAPAVRPPHLRRVK